LSQFFVRLFVCFGSFHSRWRKRIVEAVVSPGEGDLELAAVFVPNLIGLVVGRCRDDASSFDLLGLMQEAFFERLYPYAWPYCAICASSCSHTSPHKFIDPQFVSYSWFARHL
jgi:hypothetical protein